MIIMHGIRAGYKESLSLKHQELYKNGIFFVFLKGIL